MADIFKLERDVKALKRAVACLRCCDDDFGITDGEPTENPTGNDPTLVFDPATETFYYFYNDIWNELILGGSGDFFFSTTRAEAETLVAGDLLIPGAMYRISDRGDNGIFLKAISVNQFEREGTRRMLVPTTYENGVTDGNGNNWNSIWRVGVEPLSAGDLVIWNAHVYSAAGTSDDGTNPETNTTEYTLIDKTTFSNEEYVEKIFGVIYDWENDWISEQWDDRGNKIIVDINYNNYNLEGELSNIYVNQTDWNYMGHLPTDGSEVFSNNIVYGYISNNIKPDGSLISITLNNNITYHISNNTISSGEIYGNVNTGGIRNNSNSGAIRLNEVLSGISNNSNQGEIGFNKNERISSNTNTGTITRNSNKGGIQSNDNTGSILYNTNLGNIDSNTVNVLQIEANSNSGLVSNNNNIGSIDHNSNGGDIVNNDNTGSIYNNSCSSEISNNSNLGDISANSNSGGIISNIVPCTQISGNNCNGTISANSNAGMIDTNSNNGPISENSNGDNGHVRSVTISLPGSGYVVNDQIIPIGGNSDAILNVDSVDGGGAVTSISIVNSGTGYVIDTYSTSGGSGDGGLTVNMIAVVYDGGITNNSTLANISNNSNLGGITYNHGCWIINNNTNGDAENDVSGDIHFNSCGSDISGNSNKGSIEHNSNTGEIASNSHEGSIYYNSNLGSINYNTSIGDISYNRGRGNINNYGGGIIGDVFTTSGSLVLVNSGQPYKDGKFIFTGVAETFSLQAIGSGNIGYTYEIKNAGSGNLTVDVNGGGTTIYDTSLVASVVIAAGDSATFISDGTYWYKTT